MSELLSRKILIRGEPAAEGPTLCCAVLCYAAQRQSVCVISLKYPVERTEKFCGNRSLILEVRRQRHSVLLHIHKQIPTYLQQTCLQECTKCKLCIHQATHICCSAETACRIRHDCNTHYQAITNTFVQSSSQSRKSQLGPQTEGAECCNASNKQQGATMVFRLCFFFKSLILERFYSRGRSLKFPLLLYFMGYTVGKGKYYW